MVIDGLAKRFPSSFNLVSDYLAYNKANPDRTVSLRTYLTRRLHGKAKDYIGGYVRRCESILHDLEDEELVEWRAVHNARHWFWVGDAQS